MGKRRETCRFFVFRSVSCNYLSREYTWLLHIIYYMCSLIPMDYKNVFIKAIQAKAISLHVRWEFKLKTFDNIHTLTLFIYKHLILLKIPILICLLFSIRNGKFLLFN